MPGPSGAEEHEVDVLWKKVRGRDDYITKLTTQLSRLAVTEPTDLVDRLLSWHDDHVVSEVRTSPEEIQRLMTEAAERIEELEAALYERRR